MRDIKFRAWNKLGKEMLNPISIRDLSSRPSISDFIVDNLIFEQYTGLKDVNGVEIYENDLVIVGKDERNYIVKYSNKDAGFVLMYNGGVIVYNINYTTTKVIGNIHETK